MKSAKAKFNAMIHPRYPKGHPKGGEFMTKGGADYKKAIKGALTRAKANPQSGAKVRIATKKRLTPEQSQKIRQISKGVNRLRDEIKQGRNQRTNLGSRVNKSASPNELRELFTVKRMVSEQSAVAAFAKKDKIRQINKVVNPRKKTNYLDPDTGRKIRLLQSKNDNLKDAIAYNTVRAKEREQSVLKIKNTSGSERNIQVLNEELKVIRESITKSRKAILVNRMKIERLKKEDGLPKEPKPKKEVADKKGVVKIPDRPINDTFNVVTDKRTARKMVTEQNQEVMRLQKLNERGKLTLTAKQESDLADNSAIWGYLRGSTDKSQNYIAIQNSKGTQSVTQWVKEDDHLYVNYLATASHNLSGFTNEKSTKGSGAMAIAQVVRESIKQGKNGVVELYALEGARPFYEHIGFKPKGDGDYRLDSVAAKALLEKYGNLDKINKN